jgi:thiamine pyrophosphate-dependent acetolactate synthase large subunit-like protein
LKYADGCRYFLELLEREDVENIFGTPEEQRGIADGYAKASGKTGFINLHTASGPGHAKGVQSGETNLIEIAISSE